MAETVRIEIPIETIDNTDPELSKATNKLNKLSDAAKKVSSTTGKTQSGFNKMAAGAKNAGTAADKTTASVKKADTTVSKFDKSAEKTQKSLSRWAKEKYQIYLEAKDRISPILKTVGSGLKSLGSRTWRITMKAVDLVTSPVRGIIRLLRNPLFQVGAVLGVTIGIKDTIDTYKNFEAAMSTVQATSGATADELQRLTTKAKEMGATTKFTATEAAEGFNYMAMAGWKTEDMLNGIEGILNLAAASGEDLGTTSDIVTDALTAFRLSAKGSAHFADVLAAASSNANTNVSMMGETFKYAGAMAGTLGYSIEDVGVMVGLMANSGIKASSAGTQLNSIFTRLSTNANGATDAIKALGINFFDSKGQARDLSDVIDELRKATSGFTDEQKTALANTVAGTRAQSGLLAILNASESDYKKLTKAINNADGAAQDMADTRLDNLSGSLTLLQSAVDGVKISFGERLAPYIRNFADSLTEDMPAVEAALDNFMDFVDKRVDNIKRKFAEISSTDEWQNFDFFGKAKIAMREMISNPLKDWWESSGKATVAEVAGDIGKGIGTGLKVGIMTLLGINVDETVDEGVSIGASFAKGFSEGFDFDQISSKIMDGIGNLFKNALTLLPGGESASLSALMSAVMLGRIARPFIGLGKGAFSVGKGLFGSTNGGASLIGSLMGSAATGSGILGKSALLAIDLGAGNLAGGGSLSAGALSGLGMGVAAGGVAAGATVVSGTMDTYKAIKSTDKDESAAYGESAAWKFGGVAAGAAAGAALGSVIPGLGTAVGALIGAGVGGIAGWIKGDSIKEEYQDNVEEMQKEAEKAKKVFEATGLAIDDVRFRNEALTKAMNDSEVSAEEFAKMFQEECANVMENAFGDIHLSLNEVKKLASEIAFADKASEMEDFANAASNTQNSLNSLHNSVSALQKENWKVGLGLELSEIDKENYKTTIDNFVDSASSYIEDNHYEATVALKLLTNGKGSTKGLDTMYEGFESQIKKLGSKLGKEVENALKDGAIDMDEMSVIEKYQQKISDITDKLSKARSDAELQKIGIKYSGAELDAESYQAMQEELKVYADEAQTNYDDALTVTLTNLNLELSEGAITQEQYDKAVKKATKGYYAQLDDVSLRINNFNLDAITTAYADELNGILPYFEGTIQEKLQQALNNAMIKHPDVESWNTADAIGWFGLDKLPTDVATPIATQLIQSAQANTDTTKEQLIENYKKCIPTADEIYKAVDWNSFTFNDQDSLFEMIDPTWGTGTYYDLPQSEKSKTFSEYYGDNWEQSAKSTAEGIHRTMEENLDPEALNKVIEEYFTNIEIPSDNAQLIADSQEKGTAIGDSFNTGVTDSISNGSELYRSSAQTAIDSAFANPFSVNAKINITPSYSGLTLPTISTPNWGLNSGATGHNATGGYVSGKQLSWVGEDGPEAIIPLTPSRRNRALELYEQVGRNLGVGGYADGGIIGVSNTYGNFDTSDNATEGETSQTAIDSGNPQQSNSSIQVSVSMAPEFKISGGEGQSEEDIVAVVKKHIKEMADELGGEIAERLEQVFSNMPIKEA